MAKIEPGRDAEMVKRTNTVNLVFALSSIGLLLAFSLMVWVDYNREWKKYQLQFNTLEVKLTREQIEKSAGKVDAARSKQLEEAIVRGKEEEKARRAEIAKAQAEADRVHARWYAVDQNYRFTKARIDVARYDYEETAHLGHKNAEDKFKKLRGLEDQWRDYRLELEKVIAEREAARAKVTELEKTRLDAEKEQRELFTEKARLDDKLRKIEPGFTSIV